MKLVQAVGDRRAVTALTAVLALSLCGAGAAQAGTARSTDFCSVSKTVAENLANLQQQLTSASGPAELKAKYSAITSAEPALKSTAPRKLKKPLNNVLGLANTVGRYLQAANWNIAGLLPHAATLNVQANKVQPSIAALDKYWKGTCHFKI
jgi:hypothetical protein